MPQMIMPSSLLQRVQTFLAAYRAADNDDDLDVRIGRMESGEPAVMLSINGTNHGFTSNEARRLAQVAEDGMNACPSDPESAGLPNLILALRMGAEKADAAAPRPSRSTREGENG
jgi:hypothetical protein